MGGWMNFWQETVVKTG